MHEHISTNHAAVDCPPLVWEDSFPEGSYAGCVGIDAVAYVDLVTIDGERYWACDLPQRRHELPARYGFSALEAAQKWCTNAYCAESLQPPVPGAYLAPDGRWWVSEFVGGSQQPVTAG